LILVNGRRVEQDDLGFAAAGATAEQAGGDDARIIEDEDVAR
jgi:hypothetical protein